MEHVRREEFVPDGARPYAYDNTPLAIGHGQTISQPFIVALMTDLLELDAGDRVLEIGTGWRLPGGDPGRAGGQRLHKAGDGWHGWPEAAPFDGIIVTAVDANVPPNLVEQLAARGRLVLPLGPRFGGQMLTVLTRNDDGSLDRRDVLPVQFVQLTGHH